MATVELSDADLKQLEQRGIEREEIQRQIELFRRPAAYARLVRPCTVGDGIVRLDPDEVPELKSIHAEAADEGRFIKFVPASGAATRMFRELLWFQRGPGRKLSWSEVVEKASMGDKRAGVLVEFMKELGRFAFRDDLAKIVEPGGGDPDRLARDHKFQEIVDGLLGEDGLDYDNKPKGLIKFHSYPEGNRTPFEEHLVEASHHVRDGSGTCRLHLTVSAEHREAFAALFERVARSCGERHGARFEVTWSVQKPSTDTLAVDLDNRPLRDQEGRLLFRPGGHGALIENLNDLQADLVFVKNIDNIQPDHLKPTVVEWKRTLGGYLVKLQAEIHKRLRELRGTDSPGRLLDEMIRFTGSRLHVELNGRLGTLSVEQRRAWLIDRLDRPLRVCGVVPNTGEPGGGPFWVRDADGAVGRQIVERAEINPHSGEQTQVLSRSTHFNPVDIVCGVRDPEGKPYDLHRFIDPDAVIVTEKSNEGRELKALERPGLWNGAMAGWNTVFIEVPLATFAPVKSVLDLLREQHQTPC